MKKYLLGVIVTFTLTLLLSTVVYAVDAAIDTSTASNGIVQITLKDFAGKVVMVQVQKTGGEKYQYTLVNAVSNIPLQMGTGEYQVSVVENIGGKGKGIASEKFTVNSIDEKAMFKASNPQVDFAASTRAVPAYKKTTEGKSSDSDKASAVYESIVSTFKYDDDLAARVASGAVKTYVPVIDSVYDAKKGICYDYSSLFGGALRSQGIPTRLVMGYTPDLGDGKIYHAWNEVWLNNQWISVDTTLDSAAAAAGKDYIMERDRSKATIVKIY